MRTGFPILGPETVETRGRTAPDGSIVAFIQRLEIVGVLTVAEANDVEGRSIPMVVMESRQARVGGEPVVPPSRLDHVGHQPARQAVPGGKVGEPVTVEKRDSLNRAKPEIPLGIPVNLGHPIPNQAILRGENAEWRVWSGQRQCGGEGPCKGAQMVNRPDGSAYP